MPSRHLELLAQLGPPREEGWARRALRATLEAVRDGQLIEEIAVTAAWAEGSDAFCVLYSAPFRQPDPIVGIRRQRGDSDWDVTQFVDALAARVAAGLMRTSPEERAGWLRAPDDPVEFGHHIAEYISEPLGVFGKQLRIDNDGVGWWGTLNADHPTQPT